MTEKHQQEAGEPERIRVCIRPGREDWIGVAYAAETADPSAIHEYVPASLLSSRDREIREVLEGLQTFWIDQGDDQPVEWHWCDPDHDCTDACLATRDLWNKVQG